MAVLMSRTSAIVAAYALLALLVVPVFPHFQSPNEITRWLLDAAIVDHRTIEVTPVMRATGVWTEDLATVGGRYYSNKAPGAALIALPAYALARGGSMRTSWNAMRLAAATLPALLLALLLARAAKR
ncbi:MAG TPA: hypothetical protein VLU46_11990, partial [Thermoanaerobaculia bacterium]|nr:hypothetical protein [Thermoanaerobaculia bacterium]